MDAWRWFLIGLGILMLCWLVFQMRREFRRNRQAWEEFRRKRR
jgi:hypothetical protein